MQLKESIT